MKGTVGFLFIALALLVLWLAVSGRLSNLEAAWQSLKTGQPASLPGQGGSGTSPLSTPPTALPYNPATALGLPFPYPEVPVPILSFARNN